MPRTRKEPIIESKKEATAVEETRERLRQVALDLFWEKGYRSSSTRDLATALGVKQASLYYHVKNKEELLYDICYSSLQEVIDKVAAAAAGTTAPRETLEKIAYAHLVATLELQRQFLVSMYDYRSLSAECNQQINAFWSGYEKWVTEIYDKAIAAGAMRSDIPHKYHYHALMSMTNWSVLWYRPDGELSLDALGKLFTGLYLDGAVAAGARIDLTANREAITVLRSKTNPICETRNETHARLLDTASALFAARGFSTTSIREISDATGIEKASLYYYIKGKDDLCYQIILSAHEHMLQDMSTALEGVKGAEARLLCLIVAHVTSLLEHQNWFAVANEQINFLDAPKRKRIVGLRDSYEQTVRKVLIEAQESGILRSDIPARYLGFALLGVITHIYPWYQAGIDLEPQALALLLADFFLHGIRPFQNQPEP